MSLQHEITLVAFAARNEDGTRSVIDIVETSNRNASFFARRWVRDPQIAAIGTARPGACLADGLHVREVRA